MTRAIMLYDAAGVQVDRLSTKDRTVAEIGFIVGSFVEEMLSEGLGFSIGIEEEEGE